MNPFLKEVIKRPHPALVHFPITLYPVSLVFMALFWFRPDTALIQTSYWCYMIAVISILPIAITGLMDMIRLKPHSETSDRYLKIHLINGIIIALISFASGIYFYLNSPVVNEGLRTVYTTTLAALSALVMLQGLIAALMVYQHHLGIDGETR
jgi:uncharacterized membrane protein